MVIIDQIVKLFIFRLFINHEFDILRGVFRFRPKQNLNLSYVGNYIEIFSNPWVINILNILIIVLFVSGYQFYRTKKKVVSLPVRTIVTCGLAGSICSLIDKVIWGGSLDFIQILGFVTFDFKDCYINMAIIIFLIIANRHQKEISVKEYLRFCFYKKSI